MMPRRLAVALVLPATAAMCAAVYLSGLAWPILTTAYGLLGKRTAPNVELNPIG